MSHSLSRLFIMVGGVSWRHHIHNQEAESNKGFWSPARFPFHPAKTPSSEVAMPTFSVDLPCLGNAQWKYLHRHTQGCISTVILNLLKVTSEATINPHSRKTEGPGSRPIWNNSGRVTPMLPWRGGVPLKFLIL